MSRFGAKKGRKLPGAEFTWDTTDASGEADTAPTPLFPKYAVPRPRPLSDREQVQVDLYRTLRERFHDGPYYSVLGVSSGASGYTGSAKANFDPFNGMPSYSGKYQKKKRLVPRLQGRPYVMKFFPRELWPTVQPNFKPDASLDGWIPQTVQSGIKRGFEEDEEDEETLKRRRQGGDDEEGEGQGEDLEGNILDEDEEGEEEIVDDDFEDDDDEMGGDYNAEQYFDAGDDEYGDDGFGDGGGGGGDEDTY
ncbi:DNA-directed RNA polymerase III, subunit Rpc31 [Aspergillus egyptiacus]|nr:DNA-directed RNA polymerase III, subunit Rpc31 [Aspergillus egyptiacus]